MTATEVKTAQSEYTEKEQKLFDKLAKQYKAAKKAEAKLQDLKTDVFKSAEE